MNNETKIKIIESRDNGIKIFEMANDKLKVITTNLGCHILSIFAPDRNGKFEDVVLGFENVEDCSKDGSYMGAIVGRVANRIAKASFDLNGKHYKLAANNGENHLHGGIIGFNQKLFDYEIREFGIRFSYISPDGEEGYPGTLTLKVDYVLHGDCLEINYSATSDQDTIVNITNHSYFNLSGGNEKIYHHELMIDADKIACVDKNCLATGEFRNVYDTAFDFTSFHELGERINDDDIQLKNAGGYDHSFILNQGTEQIRLYHKASGRELIITTSLPTVQVYTGNFLEGGCNGKNGKPYENRDGVALETQMLPDSIHLEKEPAVILRKGEEYKAHTSYRFTVR
jgi:Galactose mutarotase and related enzymes